MEKSKFLFKSTIKIIKEEKMTALFYNDKCL